MKTKFCLLVSLLDLFLCDTSTVNAFSTVPFSSRISHVEFRAASRRHGGILRVASEDKVAANDDEPMTDDELLEAVEESHFQDLCRQLNLSTKGTRMEMLMRLRNHAEEQAQLEEKRQKELNIRVEEGANADERERHEILGGGDFAPWEDTTDEEEQLGFFYFELPKDPNEEKKKESEKQLQSATANAPKKRHYVTQNDVLAPPPPPPSEATLDEDGNRVVTVYSTADQNDLTGVAAAQPGQAAQSGTDPMIAGSSSAQPQPWDMDRDAITKTATSSELESSKAKVTELVQMLLAMSGAPAFQHFDMPEELEDINNDDDEQDAYTASAMATAPGSYGLHSTTKSVGFDPTQVPSHLLEEASQALRASRGQVLQEVLRTFEIHAVGQDGMASDNIEDGGGHFKEVSKVRAFLEGYRRAEVRKASRTTVTFLLDKLVSEGVQGLDLSLATMSRSNDDSASVEDAFELNDSLISYMNDIIREQEKKVEQLQSSTQPGDEPRLEETTETISEDPIEKLWNQTKGEGGVTIASIDPNDPKVNRILKQELEKEDQAAATMGGRGDPIPETAPEKMLLLLRLLRERIKTEAAFAGDERSRNLRLLAYCLQCTSDADREELIRNDLGGSIDRLDTFLELVASSIEYAESAPYQLQPAKRMPLNVPLLKSILDMTKVIRDQSAWKASGLRP